MKNTIKILTAIVILTASLFVNVFAVFAQDETPDSLFSDVSLNQVDRSSSQPFIARSRTASLNTDALAGMTNRSNVMELTLNLFEDVNLTMVVSTVQDGFNGTQVLNGFIAGSPNSEATLSITDGILGGGIAVDGQYYRIGSNANGEQVIEEIDQAGFVSEEEMTPEIDAEPRDYGINSTTAADDGSIIDVMVVYTTTAKNASGSASAMQNLINTAVSETNQGYTNSLLPFRMRLVHTMEVNYAETTSFSTMLQTLTNTNGGDILDQIHAERDAHYADLVVMLVSQTSSCGIGWQMTNPTQSFSTYAFTVVSMYCATGYYSFGHEMGHNMGNMHDRLSAGSYTGVYNYSYGYQDPNRNFRTIMAYNCPNGGCPRINYYSNPNVSYNGRPTGIAVGNANAANNAQSMTQTVYTVANFRVQPVSAPDLNNQVFIPLLIRP